MKKFFKGIFWILLILLFGPFLVALAEVFIAFVIISAIVWLPIACTWAVIKILE